MAFPIESYAAKIQRKLLKKQRVIEAASGRQKADLVLKNATYVNVFSNELLTCDIAGYLAHEWPQAVIVAHEKGQLDGLRVFLQAVPPGAVFGKGMDVGVIPVSGQIDPVRAQRVDRHIRAGRAADVHQ